MADHIQDQLNQQIRETIDRFETKRASELLQEAFLRKPNAETYYLASMIVEGPERITFLQKALDLDPFHEEAFAEMERLQPTKVKVKSKPQAFGRESYQGKPPSENWFKKTFGRGGTFWKDGPFWDYNARFTGGFAGVLIVLLAAGGVVVSWPILLLSFATGFFAVLIFQKTKPFREGLLNTLYGRPNPQDNLYKEEKPPEKKGEKHSFGKKVLMAIVDVVVVIFIAVAGINYPKQYGYIPPDNDTGLPPAAQRSPLSGIYCSGAYCFEIEDDFTFNFFSECTHKTGCVKYAWGTFHVEGKMVYFKFENFAELGKYSLDKTWNHKEFPDYIRPFDFSNGYLYYTYTTGSEVGDWAKYTSRSSLP